MKRSDMIKLIEDTADDDGCYINGDDILTALEKKGMLPPAYEFDIINGNLAYYYFQRSIEASGKLDGIYDGDLKPSMLWEDE